MLPNDQQLSSTPHPAPFMAPRDRPRVPLEDWSRGGAGLNDTSAGLNVYDWFFRYDEDTLGIYASVPGVVAETLIYTLTEPASEIAGSFDTNMQPVIGWTTAEGASAFRWYDPTIPGFDVIALASGSISVRITLDDVRATQVVAGVTDTIIAYVRAGTLYYRLLRDRFDTEYPLAGGMFYLYQTGMNENFRFQFSRSGQLDDEPRNLMVPRPPNREGRGPLMFDNDGNLVMGENEDYGSLPGKQGPSVQRSADGSVFHLQDHDGSWIAPSTRGAHATFKQLPFTALGERERLWVVDARGDLAVDSDEQSAELQARYREAAHDKTLTGTFIDGFGHGYTFNVASITEGPAHGRFTPNYAITGDFVNGLAPAGYVRYVDHGPHVTLSLPAAHVGAANTSALSWPAGTIPEKLRPTAARTVSCVVTKAEAETAAGMATINPDGSVVFAPLVSEVISDTPVVSYAIFKIGSNSESAPPAAGELSATTSRWRWTAPAAKIDWLFVAGGGRGGRGRAQGKTPFATRVAGGGGGAGCVKEFLEVEFEIGQPVVINVGRGATSNGGGTEYTAGISAAGKNSSGHALSRGGLSGLEGYGNAYYISGGGNGGNGNRFPANGEPAMAPFMSPPYSSDTSRAGGGGGSGNDPGDDQIGGVGFRNGGDSANPGTDLSGGGGGGGSALGGAGQGGDQSGSDNEHGGDGGDGRALADLGWGDAVAAVSAPPVVCAGGGGAGYYNGNGPISGNGGAGGSSSLGGDGADGLISGDDGLPGAADTGSGGGGACGDGTPGAGANGFVLARWISAGASYGLMIPGTFTPGGNKGLPASFTLTYPKDPATPVMSDNFRLTQEGDLRITEDGDFRIME